MTRAQRSHPGAPLSRVLWGRQVLNAPRDLPSAVCSAACGSPLGQSTSASDHMPRAPPQGVQLWVGGGRRSPPPPPHTSPAAYPASAGYLQRSKPDPLWPRPNILAPPPPQTRQVTGTESSSPSASDPHLRRPPLPTCPAARSQDDRRNSATCVSEVYARLHSGPCEWFPLCIRLFSAGVDVRLWCQFLCSGGCVGSGGCGCRNWREEDSRFDSMSSALSRSTGDLTAHLQCIDRGPL